MEDCVKNRLNITTANKVGIKTCRIELKTYKDKMKVFGQDIKKEDITNKGKRRISKIKLKKIVRKNINITVTLDRIENLKILNGRKSDDTTFFNTEEIKVNNHA